MIKHFRIKYPHAHYLFVSAGFSNVPADQIHDTDRQLHKGLSKLFRKRKELPILGRISFFHFTISKNGLIHPNIHAIVAIDSHTSATTKYFQNYYWSESLSHKCQFDYLPQVDVKHIAGIDIQTELERIFSYCCKPQNYICEFEIERPELITEELITGLAYSHSISYGGEFYKLAKQKPEHQFIKQTAAYAIILGEYPIVRSLQTTHH